MDFLVLLLDSMHLDPLMFLRSLAQLGLASLASGVVCLGPLLFVLDHAQYGSLLPLQGPA